MDKKIIIGAGVIVVAGGFVAHGLAGKSADQQIRQSLAALEAGEDIAVSQVQTHKGLGKTSLTAHLTAVDAPALSGDLAMDVGYLSRKADGSLTFSGDVLEGVVDFTTGLGRGKRHYTFSADELSAAKYDVTLEQTEGSGYVDAEKEHFALNMQTRRIGFQDASSNLQVNGLHAAFEHTLDAQQGEGRSHARVMLEGAGLTVDQGAQSLEAFSLGATELHNTATLDGETLTSQLYFSADDAVYLDSEPGEIELDVTTDGLNYAAIEAVSSALERSLDALDSDKTLTPQRQQALERELQDTLVEETHTLLAHSPALQLNTLDVDAALPMLGRLTAELSGSLAFDGDGLAQDATNALLATLDADTQRLIMAKGRPTLSAGEAQAEFASRVSGEVTLGELPERLVAQLPPAFQALLINGEAPHTFAWENGQLLYNGEPLERALAQ
ncbi:MAG: YdgA family protein [Halomonas subglaciescola]|nr:YdgA family protein [Halomonas subglaciescola]